MEFDLPKHDIPQAASIIKVIGVGGGGGDADEAVGQDAADQRTDDVAVAEIAQHVAPVGLVETVLRENAGRGIRNRAAVDVVEQRHQHDQEENLVAERRNSCAFHGCLTLQNEGRSQKVGRVRRIFIVLPKAPHAVLFY